MPFCWYWRLVGNRQEHRHHIGLLSKYSLFSIQSTLVSDVLMTSSHRCARAARRVAPIQPTTIACEYRLFAHASCRYICRLNVVLIDVSIYHHHFHVVKLGPWVPVISQAPSGWASALSSFLSLLLAMLACILLADLEHLDQGRHRAAVALLALAAILVSATSTHGLGGFLRHGLSGDPRPSGLATWRGRKSRSRPQWRFFQPF